MTWKRYFNSGSKFLSDVWRSDGFSNTVLVNSTRAYIERQLPSNQLRVWFAEEHGELVATGAMIFFDRMPTMDNPLGLEAYLLSVYTRPAHRGRGIATVIMRAMIAHARDSGVGRIFLHASDAGRPVYEKLGFHAANYEMDLFFTKRSANKLPIRRTSYPARAAASCFKPKQAAQRLRIRPACKAFCQNRT